MAPAWDELRPQNVLGEGGHHGARLLPVEEVRFDPVRPLIRDGVGQVVPLLRRGGDVHRAGEPQGEISIQFLWQGLDECEVGGGKGGDGPAGRVMQGRARSGHAGVAAGSAGRQLAPLQQENAPPALRQPVRDRASRDAAADHDGVRAGAAGFAGPAVGRQRSHPTSVLVRVDHAMLPPCHPMRAPTGMGVVVDDDCVMRPRCRRTGGPGFPRFGGLATFGSGPSFPNLNGVDQGSGGHTSARTTWGRDARFDKGSCSHRRSMPHESSTGIILLSRVSL